MKILIIIPTIAFIILSLLIYKDLTLKIRYKDDPDTKSEWFDIGYKTGVEAGKIYGYFDGYIKAGDLLKVNQNTETKQ